jgi:hypothetical protein
MAVIKDSIGPESRGVTSRKVLTISSISREYPCDHYTAIINVTLMNTGCPRTEIHETALQLLQILDKRFFGSFSPLGSVVEGGMMYTMCASRFT